MSRFRSVIGKLGMLFAALAVVLMSFAPGIAGNAAAEWSAPRTVYFQETGHSLDGVFLDAWRGNNGWANYGLPITPEITLENGHVVQYLQFARFEYWPEADANGNYFVLGKVGQDLKPNVLQRSMIATTSSPGDIATVTEQMKAWLPVPADSAVATNPDHTYVEATSHTVFGGFRDFWLSTGDVNYLGNPLTQEYTIGDATYQVFEYGQLKWTPELGTHMVPVGEMLASKYNLDTSAQAQGDIPTYDEALFIAPTPEPTEVASASYVPGGGEVWVDINLSAQYMTVYQGSNVLLELYISSGTPGWETPTGTFYINRMYLSDTMVGAVAGESWYVPDVPHAMYFTDQGHAIHGTYWHNNFGVPMSHGCINMPEWAAAYLYSIASVGMRIEIHY